MIAQHGYAKGERFERRLYRALNKARRAKMIPFDWIRDDGILGGGYWGSDPHEIIADWREQAER